MNRTKGTKRTHPKEANGTWTKVNKVHALFTSISSFGSSLFFIYWIKTKEKGVRSLTLFPLVFYSIKEQQRTQLISRLSSEWEWRKKEKRAKNARRSLLFLHFSFHCCSFPFLHRSLQWNEVKAWMSGKKEERKVKKAKCSFYSVHAFPLFVHYIITE